MQQGHVTAAAVTQDSNLRNRNRICLQEALRSIAADGVASDVNLHRATPPSPKPAEKADVA